MLGAAKKVVAFGNERMKCLFPDGAGTVGTSPMYKYTYPRKTFRLARNLERNS